MANYIETKVRYEKMHDNGKVKKVTEPYMVDALSFTEAEARITEKKTATHILVQAADLDCALYNFKEGMKGTMADYEIASISETAIMDVFTYKAKDNDDVAQHNLNKLISVP